MGSRPAWHHGIAPSAAAMFSPPTSRENADGDGYASDASNASSSSSENALEPESDSLAARLLFVQVVERNGLGSLTLNEKEAVAGATACVCFGLDGDLSAATEVLRLTVIDLLGLEITNLKAVEPLMSNEPPEALEDVATGIQRARDAFITRERDAGQSTSTDAVEGANDSNAREPSRWTVILASLVVAAAAVGRHDARVAATLRRLATAAHVPWEPIAELEDLIAKKLKQALPKDQLSDAHDEQDEDSNDATSALENTAITKRKASDTKKFSFTAMREKIKDMSYGQTAAVGAAAVFGGGLMFITGGVAAPAVLASLASLGAAGGVVGAVALSAGSLTTFFGGATGISYILGGVGAGLTGWRTARRLEGLSQFAFLPLKRTRVGLRVFLFVPGFLRDPHDLFKSFGAADGVYSAVVDLEASGDESDDSDNGTSETNKSDEPGGTRTENSKTSTSPLDKKGIWRAISNSVKVLNVLKPNFDECSFTTTSVPCVGVTLGTTKKGKIYIANVTSGGVADKSGVAEGSVLVSVQFVSDDGDVVEGEEGTGASDVSAAPSPVVEVGGVGKVDAAGVARLFKQASQTRVEHKGRPVTCELRLRRNLSQDADVEVLARRRQKRVVGSDARNSLEEITGSVTDSPIKGVTPSGSSVGLSSAESPNPLTLETPNANPKQWPLPHGEQFVVSWEHALLMDLGGAMSAFGRAALTKYVGAQAVAHTSLAALASAVAWPVTLLNAGGFIDSPWALAEARSKDAGRALADALLEGKAGKRPCTLVAYSLGCDVVKHCCQFLAEAENDGGLGLIQDIVLVGAPMDASKETWTPLRKVTSGRLINTGDFGDLNLTGSSNRGGDWMLRFLFRKKNWAIKRGVAAWTHVEHVGVENIDVGEVCGVHVEIPDRMGAILEKVGLDK